MSAGLAWLALACYTLQIYFDFSGYSDMAIGLGKMFGFDFLGELQLPVRRQIGDRVLAAVAYLAIKLAARLRVHPDGRQPWRTVRAPMPT